MKIRIMIVNKIVTMTKHTFLNRFASILESLCDDGTVPNDNKKYHREWENTSLMKTGRFVRSGGS